jgi:hypothetical protein
MKKKPGPWKILKDDYKKNPKPIQVVLLIVLVAYILTVSRSASNLWILGM